MSNNILVVFFIMQFLIQMFIYKQTVFIAKAVIKFNLDIITIFIDKNKREDTISKLTIVFLLIYNILISMLVLKFTSTGAYSGMSNLFASCFVGVFMYFDFRKGGKYSILKK